MLTQGTLLDGRVLYAQPAAGYRSGIEPVLLAAAVPAQPGQRVLEAGTGAGAGLLCLLARVPDLVAIGLEIDPATAALARDNARRNGTVPEIHTADVTNPPPIPHVHHVFANPPWHDPTGTPPLDLARTLARHLPKTGLCAWVAPLAALLLPRGTLTLALPAASVPEAMAALQQAGLGRIALCPLWPRTGVQAKLILLQARAERGPGRILPGLVLHETGGAYTEAVQAILRHGGPLVL